MRRQNDFLKTVSKIAIPVTLQSMLQSSFSVVDQIMIGQLGSTSVAAVGLAGKFASVFSVVVSAVAAVAGIMIAQYIGQKNEQEVRRSFRVNLLFATGIAFVFTALCFLAPVRIMGLYASDQTTCQVAGRYLFVLGWTFLPIAGTTMLATLFRCEERATAPLYASIAAAVLNTGLNYILIFGRFGAPAMGAYGAAIATAVSQFANFVIMLILFSGTLKKRENISRGTQGRFCWRQYAVMLLPMLACELMWSLGENVYAGIYGHLGTEDCAAMTLMNPIQSLMIGALCGLSQAASIIVGKQLGEQKFHEAFQSSKKLMLCGFLGSACLSVLLLAVKPLYVSIYQVEPSVKALTMQIMTAYAIIAPFKIQNMILGGGILRSGGKTNYVLWIDMLGTWAFGVPLGLLSAFVWKLSIPYVYFLLSLEECVRFGVSLLVFRRKSWMQKLNAAQANGNATASPQ